MVELIERAGDCRRLTRGEPAGAPDAKGQFPKGSVNARVVERLRSIAELGMEEEEKDKEAAKDKPKESKPRAKPAPNAAKE